MPKQKIGLYIAEETAAALEALAESEVRTVPNLIEAIVTSYLREKGLLKDPLQKEGKEKND